LAGFGLWAKSIVSGNNSKEGVAVIRRTDDNYHEVINGIAGQLLGLMDADENDVRRKCFNLAEYAEWSKFITHYYNAFDMALRNASMRRK
jgi:hypothetical protein